MNKLIHFRLLFLLILLISFGISVACGQLNKNGDKSQIENLPVTYSGTIPCEDCPGIDYDIQIMKDSFSSYRFYRDRDSETYSKTGTWKLKNDTLFTFVNGRPCKVFLYGEERLIMLDNNREQITGDLANQYRLESSADIESISLQHQQLKRAGIIFTASGNEPFWNIRIDGDHKFVYRTPGEEITARAAEPFVRDKLTVIQATSDSIDFEVEIRKWICHDSMSGFPFTHEVTLRAGSEIQLKGCGIFLQE